MTEHAQKYTFAFSLLTMIIGSIYWLAILENRTLTNEEHLKKLSVDFEELTDKSNAINNRLHRIEEKLDFVSRMVDNSSRRGRVNDPTQ